MASTDSELKAKSKPRKKGPAPEVGLQKCLTGIKGFDEITEGGLPGDRITLLRGGTGTGKTLPGGYFLISGVRTDNEPGVFMSFEETEDDLYKDVASLNFDLRWLVAAKKIVLDFVLLERKEIREAGEFNLEPIFVRLEHAIDSVKAKRVLLHSIESLFAGVTDVGITDSRFNCMRPSITPQTVLKNWAKWAFPGMTV